MADAAGGHGLPDRLDSVGLLIGLVCVLVRIGA